MASYYLLDDIVDRVRKRGGYETADGDYSVGAHPIPSGTLLMHIEDAHNRVWEMWSETDHAWNLQTSYHALSPASGTYTLPESMKLLRSVDIRTSEDGDWQPVRRANRDDDAISDSAVGTPEAYRLVGSSIVFLPAPSDGTTLRLRWTPSAPSISDPSLTIWGDDGFYLCVVLMAIIACRESEERDASDFIAELRDLTAHFKESIRRRDRGTPHRLRPRTNDISTRRRRSRR